MCICMCVCMCMCMRADRIRACACVQIAEEETAHRVSCEIASVEWLADEKEKAAHREEVRQQVVSSKQ